MGGGPVPTSNPRSTALYDAVYLAANDKLKTEVGRKAMIVFTDGEDDGSRVKIRDAIEAAQKADAICYVILIADRGGWYQGFGVGRHEEAGGRNRRTRDRSRQQPAETAAGLRPDPERAAQPVQHWLHADEHQARRFVSQDPDPHQDAATTRCRPARATTPAPASESRAACRRRLRRFLREPGPRCFAPHRDRWAATCG